MGTEPSGPKFWRAAEFLAGLILTAIAAALFFGTSVSVRIHAFMDPSTGPSAMALVPPFFLTGVLLIAVAVLRQSPLRRRRS